MRAVVYHGPGRKAWEEVPDPEIIGDGDAIVRVDAVTICGTDLHILKGDVPAVRDGRILGHEAVGTIEEVGGGVHTLAPGQRVLVSCISACGTCRFCREGRYGQCLGTGGWILGHKIDGAQLFSPSHIVAIDLSDARLEAAMHFGADVIVNNSRENPLKVIRDLTGRLGADVSIEAVGVPATFELAVKLIRPGGRIANVGEHGAPATLDLEQEWIRDITITTGLVDTYSTPTLLKLVTSGQI
ncbi:MAG: alcohol dehydrogenase catalytic domain-containing protein, partial [Streptosporangiaceae bacterium]